MKYKAWGEVRYSTNTALPDYTLRQAQGTAYTGQYSHTADFGLMFYNARWYDPSLGRFAQADSLVPGGVQGLDRYAYVNNSPMNYVDPSGHEPHTPGSCYESVNGVCGYKYPTPQKGFKPSNPSPEMTHTEYMGGASPAGVYEWQDIPGRLDNKPSWWEAFDDFSGIFEMYSPMEYPTLQAYLTYVMSENKSVNKISISIINNGESSAKLRFIKLSEEALPSMNSCTIDTTCQFVPQSPVTIDSGQSEVLTICQNCLSDGSTTFIHSFPNNKDKQIEVLMYLQLFFDSGSNGIESIPVPFTYTIPRR